MAQLEPKFKKQNIPKMITCSLVPRETFTFIALCIAWYSFSAITNNIGKQILISYRYPITLTWVQFGFVALFASLYTRFWPGARRLRPFTSHVFLTVCPLAVFQIIGHIFSSIAYSYVAVSFAHTIKALAPLFTVLIYRLCWNVLYPDRIYYSLAPLTIGVMLVCSNKISFHPIGFICSLASTMIFVLQNIFSKKLFLHARHASSQVSPINSTELVKLDKLNLLFYSAFLAFAAMFPVWIYSEGYDLLTEGKNLPRTFISGLFVLNGTSAFLQNLFAFSILSLVSPVTYSIASLVKRIFIISASIVWFGDTVTVVQVFGIGLTFTGLWLYDRAKADVAKSEARLADCEFLLPMHEDKKYDNNTNNVGTPPTLAAAPNGYRGYGAKSRGNSPPDKLKSESIDG